MTNQNQVYCYSQGVNHAQQLLAWEQQNLIHTQNALNFVASGAGRRKRQVDSH